MTPAQLRAEADEKDSAGRACLDRGETREAAVMFLQAEVRRAAADEMESLAKRSTDVQDGTMTGEQIERRGRGIAKAKAHNRLLEEITAKFGSARKFCASADGLRRKCAPSSLTAYMDGTTPCPRWIADRVRELFPKLSWTWPAGIVE